MTTRHPSLDPSRCQECRACEVACVEDRYGLTGLIPDDPVVLERRRLTIRSYAELGGTGPELAVCTHCAPAPCIAACPHDALLRHSDGRVQLHESRCTGCGHCITPCPVRAIRRATSLGLAMKCDGCAPRGAPERPPCVLACPHGALEMSTGEARSYTSPPRGGPRG